MIFTAKFRLSKFDKAVLELVKGGVYKTDHLALKLHVDEAQFKSRLDELAAAGLVVVSDGGATTRLGIEGFNALPDKKTRRKPAKKKDAAKAQPEQKAPEAEPKPQPVAEQKQLAREIVPEKKVFPPVVPRQAASPVKIVVPSEELPVAEDANDLAELLRKGAPTQRARPQQPKKAEEPIVRTEAKPLTKGGDEVCELCKAKFSLAVSGKGPSKFGHCFCGAAYHKDCYESLISSTKKCVRCGKKLELYLDKQSEEAVKTLRDAFE